MPCCRDVRGKGKCTLPAELTSQGGTDLAFPPSLRRGGHLNSLHQGPRQPGALHCVQRMRQRLSYLPKIEQAVSGTARVCVQTDGSLMSPPPASSNGLCSVVRDADISFYLRPALPSHNSVEHTPKGRRTRDWVVFLVLFHQNVTHLYGRDKLQHTSRGQWSHVTG